MQEKLEAVVEELLTKIEEQLKKEMTSAEISETADAIYTLSKVLFDF